LLTSGNGYVEFQFGVAQKGLTVGLNSGSQAVTRTDIEFGLTAVGGLSIVEVREAGIYGGDVSYTVSDVFRIEIIGSQIFYKKNGVTFASHSVSSFAFPYHADVVILSVGGRVANAKMTTPQLPTGPLPPTNFTATAVSSSLISLSWTDNSADETGFIVERSLAGANSWATIATTVANVTSLNDTGVAALTSYDYRLHSTNANGDSPNVFASNIATPGPTPTPTPSPSPSPSPTPTPSPSPTPLQSFDVFWTSLANSTATGSTIRKSGGSMLEDAHGRSVNMLFGGDGFVEFQFPDNGLASVGLNTGAQAQTRTDLEYAFSTNGANIAEIRENGIYHGDTSYVASDIFRIEISGNQVLYKKNGITLSTTPGPLLVFPYRVEATLISPDVRVANVKMSNSTAPALATREGSPTLAAALDSVNFLAGPFPLVNNNNFSSDHRTRILLFVVNFELQQNEDFHQVVSVQLKNQQGSIFNLPIEGVNKVPGFDWLTCIVARLDEQVVDVGNLTVTATLRGVATDPLVITTKP